jgi:hypothetical protein
MPLTPTYRVLARLLCTRTFLNGPSYRSDSHAQGAGDLTPWDAASP